MQLSGHPAGNLRLTGTLLVQPGKFPAKDRDLSPQFACLVFRSRQFPSQPLGNPSFHRRGLPRCRELTDQQNLVRLPVGQRSLQRSQFVCQTRSLRERVVPILESLDPSLGELDKLGVGRHKRSFCLEHPVP